MWQRWRSLSAQDKRDLRMLAWLLPWVNLGLHLRGARRTRRWLLAHGPTTTPQAITPEQLARAERLAALAARLGRYGRHQTSCLRQALAVEYGLRRESLPAELRLGTRKLPDGSLQAHAWVELDGTALAQGAVRHQPIAGAADRLR